MPTAMPAPPAVPKRTRERLKLRAATAEEPSGYRQPAGGPVRLSMGLILIPGTSPVSIYDVVKAVLHVYCETGRAENGRGGG